jgi:hypothetical protein
MEPAARRAVRAAQDKELVCKLGEASEERHSERAAAQKRDPAQH